jgi:hypothetical protein
MEHSDLAEQHKAASRCPPEGLHGRSARNAATSSCLSFKERVSAVDAFAHHDGLVDVARAQPAWTITATPSARREPRVNVSNVSGLNAHHEAQRSLRAPALNTSAMLHICRRSLRNVLGQDGTTRDAEG